MNLNVKLSTKLGRQNRGSAKNLKAMAYPGSSLKTATVCGIVAYLII